jgi:hypothetical protein
MNDDWTRNDFKTYLLFAKPTHVLLNNVDTGIKLVAEMDLFNNHIKYQIYDLVEEIIYDSSFEITEAVDLFFNKVEEIKKEQ